MDGTRKLLALTDQGDLYLLERLRIGVWVLSK